MFIEFFKPKDKLAYKKIKIGSFEFGFDNHKRRSLIEKKIRKINQKSLLPMQLITKYDDELKYKLLQNTEYFNNIMTEEYYTKDYDLIFGAYPSMISDYHLTQINLYTDKYCVYNISVGMSLDIAEEILVRNEFCRVPDVIFSGQNYICYDYYDVHVKFITNNFIISKISVEIDWYDVGNWVEI